MTTIPTLYIKQEPFQNIYNNLKTIEVRKYQGFIKTLKINQIINLVNQNQKLKIKIKNIKIYPTLKVLLDDTQLIKINPNLVSFQNPITYFQKYYKLDDLNKPFVAYIYKIKLFNLNLVINIYLILIGIIFSKWLLCLTMVKL